MMTGAVNGSKIEGEVFLSANRRALHPVAVSNQIAATDIQFPLPEKGYPNTAEQLAKHPRVRWQEFPDALNRFVYNVLHPEASVDSDSVYDIDFPKIESCISVYHCATAIFFAPSDISGVGGMRKEVIRATPTWRRAGPRYDCVFVETDSSVDGFQGLHVARIKLFFSFTHKDHEFSCAIIHWFESIGDAPDPENRHVDC